MLVVVLFGVMALFFFTKKIHDPLSKEIKALVKKNNELVQNMADLREEPVDTDRIEKKIKRVNIQLDTTTEQYNQLLFSKLANREQVQEVALEISGLASDNGLTVREMLPNDKAVEKLTADLGAWQKGFGLIPYAIKMEGNFLDFHSFLKEFVSLELLVLLGSIKVESVDDNGNVTITGTILI